MPQYKFDKKETSPLKSLIITKASKQKLTKNQDAFNKLSSRIERLQKEIAKKQMQFDLAIKMYGEKLHPTKMIVLEQRKELVVILWGIYKEKRLARYDQQNLKQIVREHLQRVFMELTEPPTKEIKDIFNELEGAHYDSVMEQEKEAAKEQMIEQLTNLKIDISEIDKNDEAILAQKLHEAKIRLYEAQQAKINAFQEGERLKTKSKKQIEAEKIQQEIDAVKQKNIGTIYKQLAKLFHPDLEQDEERKLEKVLLMQELTAAYEAKNLHALLSLELKWIHNEKDHLESLTEEKLAIYLEILKEQVAELQIEKEDIIHLPQYRVLLEEFGWEIQRYPIEIIRSNVTYVNELVGSFKANISDFKSEYALRYIKQMIKQWKQAQEEMDDADSLNRFL